MIEERSARLLRNLETTNVMHSGIRLKNQSNCSNDCSNFLGIEKEPLKNYYNLFCFPFFGSMLYFTVKVEIFSYKISGYEGLVIKYMGGGGAARI